nr:hypothetical protein [Klebsiella pneumoniae]
MLAIRLSDEIESVWTRWRSKPAEQRRFMRGKQYWRIWKTRRIIIFQQKLLRSPW